MKVLLGLLLTVVLCSMPLAAQVDPTVLLKGKVVNNGSPAGGLEMIFRDESGTIASRTRSARDGSYQVVLKSGHRYDISMTDEELTRYTLAYEIPKYDKYIELEQDLPIGTEPAPSASSKSTKKSKKTKSKKSKKGR